MACPPASTLAEDCSVQPSCSMTRPGTCVVWATVNDAVSSTTQCAIACANRTDPRDGSLSSSHARIWLEQELESELKDASIMRVQRLQECRRPKIGIER